MDCLSPLRNGRPREQSSPRKDGEGWLQWSETTTDHLQPHLQRTPRTSGHCWCSWSPSHQPASFGRRRAQWKAAVEEAFPEGWSEEQRQVGTILEKNVEELVTKSKLRWGRVSAGQGPLNPEFKTHQGVEAEAQADQEGFSMEGWGGALDNFGTYPSDT